MAIMSALVVYVIPALLGRTYNLKNETVGPDIFNHEDIERARKIECFKTTSEYKVVTEISEATDFLDVSGELSLKLKSGVLDINGKGSYLKETASLHNKVDILIKVRYESVVMILPSDIKPIPNWQDSLKGIEATHYIRSIVYGGELVASVRFTTQNEADKMIVMAEVQGQLNSKSGSFGAGLAGKLELIKKKIADTASMDISYYATVDIENIATTIDGLTELIDKFPEQTKKVNNGYGVPLSMEIFSLEGLQKDLPTYWQTMALSDQMVALDEYFSDIRNAKQRLADWMSTIPPILPREQKHKIGHFQTKLDGLSRIFSETIANLDLSIRTGGGEQFKPAFQAYLGDREEAIPNMYLKELSKLKVDVLSHTPSFEADFGGAHYIYWGSDSCPRPAKLVYSGVMSATTKQSGSSEFTCMPEHQQYLEIDTGSEDEYIDEHPQVKPVVFQSRRVTQGYPHYSKRLMRCASCRVPGKSTQSMFIGRIRCPDGWMEQQQGVLVSTPHNIRMSELVCLDTVRHYQEAPSSTSDSLVITEVSPSCGPFPCKENVLEQYSISCTVCSKTRTPLSLSDVLRL